MKKKLHNNKTNVELELKTNRIISKERKENIDYSVKQKLYFGYFSRLFFVTVFFIILLCSSFYFLGNSFSIIQSKKISYIEKSDLDYKVYLKKNDFYESEYLGKNMSYIASLIDYIDLFFDYDFNVDTLVDGSFDYKIVAVLDINNETSSSTYFSKEYILLEKNNEKIEKNDNFHIHENIKLDYDYYNKLANNFKSTYGIGTTSNLNVYLKISRDITSDFIKHNELDNQNSMSINIPLSQKAININMNYDEIKNQDNIISNEKIEVENIIMFVLGFVFLILSILLLVRIYHKVKVLNIGNSNYDKYIKRLLKEYDRLIVVTETMPNLNKLQVFKLKHFSELLDVRDNTKKPIMYYDVVEHVKCYFYVKDNNDIYLLCIKAVDMEKNNEK